MRIPLIRHGVVIARVAAEKAATMRNINRVIIAGNLTRDPEYRMLPSETPVASFGVALNRRWKDKTGDTKEETTFVDCEAFGRQAEVLRAYGRKGRGLFVEGRLRLDQWQDKEGRHVSKMRVVVDNVQFTDSRSESDHGETVQRAEPSRLSRSELEELLPF